MDFTCVYCNHPTTITSPNEDDNLRTINILESRFHDGKKRAVYYHAIACPNISCKKLSFLVSIQEMIKDVNYNWVDTGRSIDSWQLLPDSLAKPQPDYIPLAIVEDYNEASKILNLSPKAAASLARRCLQGMIRDFYKINKSSLSLEIDELEEIVSPEVWSAIDAVRSVGNIGAHMERDVNLIVEIEPNEAELLIQLIEDLFEDWYVVRNNRTERQKKIKLLASVKQAKRKGVQIESSVNKIIDKK